MSRIGDKKKHGMTAPYRVNINHAKELLGHLF